MLLDIRGMLNSGKDLVQQETFLREVDMIAEKPKRIVSQVVVILRWCPSINHLPELGVIVYVSGHQEVANLIVVSILT